MKNKSLLFLLLIVFTACDRTSLEWVSSQQALHSRAVGASANELLSDSRYSALKVEVQYMGGFAPDPAALAQLQQFLETHVNKPGGIVITTKEVAPAGDGPMSTQEVIQYEEKNRLAYSTGNQLALYILYTNSYSTESGKLGLAYRNTSTVLFGKAIHDNSGGPAQVSREKLETTVLQHAIGHLLGLVDLGSPMQTDHKDREHGSHCSAANCLMHHAAETTAILSLLNGGNVPVLDAACTADLKANGGK